jgi:hypothetical protein
VGTSTAELCPGEEVHALDAEGRCWLFSGGCLADGFAAVDGLAGVSPPCRETFDTCPAPTDCGPGEIATVDGCLSCNDADQALYAALNDRIQSESWNLCETDADCYAADWRDACAIGQCPMALASGAPDDFGDAVNALSDAYCTDVPAYRERCGGPRDVDCDTRTACLAGRCVMGVSCEDRDLESCERDEACSLATGFAFRSDGACFEAEPVALGCLDSNLSCPPVTTAALDAGGACYQLGGCLPAGLTRAPDEAACAQATVTCP